MTIGIGSGTDFDQILESELQRAVSSVSGPSPEIAQAAYHAAFVKGGTMSAVSTLAAAASTKAAAGLAAAALVAGAGSAAAAVTTGSTNPAVWGRTVTAAVATCKADLTGDQHGIGQCVSKVAREKGVAERNLHSASAARTHHPIVASSDHPGGPPSDRPGGPPSDRPGGPPSDRPGNAPMGTPAGPPTTLPIAQGGGNHPTGAPVNPPVHR